MANGGLRVITGGLTGQFRLGYGVPGKFFTPAGTAKVIAWPWTKEPEAVRKPELKSDPPRRVTLDQDGKIFCTKCGRFFRAGAIIRQRLQKDKEYVCPNCGTEYAVKAEGRSIIDCRGHAECTNCGNIPWVDFSDDVLIAERMVSCRFCQKDFWVFRP